MAATCVSNRGAGIIWASCQQISTSWRAAWNTFTTRGLANSSNSEARSMPRQRVDDHRLVDACHLQHAEFGIIGALAQELGVDRHERMPPKAAAGLVQCSCICNWLHPVG